MFSLVRFLAAPAGVPALCLAACTLAACTSPTTILSHTNPSRATAAAWADYRSLPVHVHGATPYQSKADLAALFPAYHPAHYAALGDLPAAGPQRHLVIYVNPARRLSRSQLCDGATHFPRGTQIGQSAYVVGALCDGTRLITLATGKILTQHQDAAELAYNFNIIRDQLYQSLYRGANDPDRGFEGY